MICEPLHHFNYQEIYWKSIVRSKVWGNVALSKWSKTQSPGWFVFHLQRTCLIISSSISLKNCRNDGCVLLWLTYSAMSQEITATGKASLSSTPGWFTPKEPWGTPTHHGVIKVMLGKHYGSSHKVIWFLSPYTVSYQSDWSPGHLTGWHNC